MASSSLPARHRLRLHVLPGVYSVCRFAPTAPIPEWALASDFFSITHTPHELSVVCGRDVIPEPVLDSLNAEHDWACIEIEGPIPFELTGVLNACLQSLAEALIGIFALSTFDTDYILVKSHHLESAVEALHNAGHYI
ncbi:MAG TPA: ACT domain-containing protein [Clostridia bacterium]|nr:ACT domain-containing protein [Clostridia bacterium]